jgi:catalase
MVHPCGSVAFGYFETTADVSALTKVWRDAVNIAASLCWC